MTKYKVAFHRGSELSLKTKVEKGRVIRLEKRNGRLFITVVRLMIGQFAFINFFKTGSLHQQLSHFSKSL